MPCLRCDNGKWKWGKGGRCQYETKADCEAAHEGDTGMKQGFKKIEIKVQADDP